MKGTKRTVGIVIPVKNEIKRLRTLVPKLKYYFSDVDCKIIIMDGKSTDDTAVLCKIMGCIVPYRVDGFGYGDSLREGLGLAYYTYDCEYIIQMDADHDALVARKFYDIMLTMNKNVDYIIGIESGTRITRRVTNFLIKYFLGLGKYKHPTCGYRLWTARALTFINLRTIHAKWFAIQIEMLQKANKLGLRCHQVPFESRPHRGVTSSPRFIVEWLLTFFRLFRIRVWWILRRTLALLIGVFIAPQEVLEVLRKSFKRIYSLYLSKVKPQRS